ncbi:MAG: cytochrome P460 family protein [Gammaproteobacteria bacterium]|nr:cytochrome P460 family protein [Gammaproteobacteria bacterium]
MKLSYWIFALTGALGAAAVIAGGRMDFIKYPDNYKEDFSRYMTANRANDKPQMVHIYANDRALQSATDGDLAYGSSLVMEVYKAATDEKGEPLKQADGVYKPGKLAAVAVMEKRYWGVEYPAEKRAGDWGFAFYDANGQPKANDLQCASCHKPKADQDFLFTLPQLSEYARTHQM